MLCPKLSQNVQSSQPTFKPEAWEFLAKDYCIQRMDRIRRKYNYIEMIFLLFISGVKTVVLQKSSKNIQLLIELKWLIQMISQKFPSTFGIPRSTHRVNKTKNGKTKQMMTCKFLFSHNTSGMMSPWAKPDQFWPFCAIFGLSRVWSKFFGLPFVTLQCSKILALVSPNAPSHKKLRISDWTTFWYFGHMDYNIWLQIAINLTLFGPTFKDFEICVGFM